MVIPESVKYIGKRAFYGCEALEDVSFNAGKPEFEDVDWVFPACKKLQAIKVVNENKDYIIEKFGNRFTYINSSENNLVIAVKDENWYIPKLEKRMLDAWQNFEEDVYDIEIYNIPDNNAYKIILNIANEHPEYYYISTSAVSYSSDRGVVVSFDVIYNAFDNEVTEEFKQEVKKSIDAMNDEIAKILSFITEDMTDLEKAVYVHDYMVMNYEYDPNYDPTHYDSNNLDQVLSHTSAMLYRKVGVCSGYARAFKLLMDKLGIDCKYVKGTAIKNDPEKLTSDHAWNVVKIGGKWYYVDVTWDERYGFGFVSRKSFLKSYKSFSVSHSNYTYSYNSYCQYDNYENVHWIDAESPVIPINNKLYYMMNKNLYEYTNENNIRSIYSSAASDSGLAYYNNKLYFNTDAGISMMDLETEQVYLIADIPNTSGLVLDGNILKYGKGGKYTGAYAGEINLDAIAEKIICTKTKFLNGKFLVVPTGIENGNKIIFVCYNDKQMVYIEPFTYAGEESKTFTPDKEYDEVKVMVWNNFENCMPLCSPEDVSFN